MSGLADEVLAAARRKAVEDFVNRQSVAYRRHSAHAIAEDMALAVREFGVPIEAFYPDPADQAALRAAIERDAEHEGERCRHDYGPGDHHWESGC